MPSALLRTGFRRFPYEQSQNIFLQGAAKEQQLDFKGSQHHLKKASEIAEAPIVSTTMQELATVGEHKSLTLITT